MAETSREAKLLARQSQRVPLLESSTLFGFQPQVEKQLKNHTLEKSTVRPRTFRKRTSKPDPKVSIDKLCELLAAACSGGCHGVDALCQDNTSRAYMSAALDLSKQCQAKQHKVFQQGFCLESTPFMGQYNRRKP